MMRRLVNCGLKTILAALLLTSSAFCQSDQKQTTTEQKQPAFNETADTYRLEIAIRELQDGKLLSTRNYTALVQDHPYHPRTIKIGSRLPLGGTAGNPNVQYFDVGTNLTFRVRTLEGRLLLSLIAEVSNVAAPEPASTTKAADYPVVRQFRTDQEAAIPLGKPTLLDSVDDPNSNHKFQIEVTATKEKV